MTTPQSGAIATIALAGATAGSLFAAQPAVAHPHMFFDAQAQFVVDAQARLTGIDVGFVVDDFNSLYTLAELSLDQDGDGALTEDEAAELADALRLGLGDYGYFTDLRLDGAPIDIGAPTEIVATLAHGRIAARLDYDLDAPLPIAGAEAVLALYDPTYFTAVTMAAAPALLAPNDADARCTTTLDPFEPTTALAATQQLLAALGREETPEEANVGERFADRARLQCAA